MTAGYVVWKLDFLESSFSLRFPGLDSVIKLDVPEYVDALVRVVFALQVAVYYLEEYHKESAIRRKVHELDSHPVGLLVQVVARLDARTPDLEVLEVHAVLRRLDAFALSHLLVYKHLHK